MDAESADKIVPVEADASTNNGNHNEPLVSVIRKMIEMPEPQSSNLCRIYRVPYHLRKWKKEAYTPRVISIGPFHHGNQRLGNMEKQEKHKAIYLKKFITNTKLDLEKLVTIISEQEESIRSCYAESNELTKDDFVKMILLDATFILVLFLGQSWEDWKFGDPMLVHPLRAAVRFDLLLLENQLPFFVIEILFNLAFPSHQNRSTLIKLILDFFACYNNQGMEFTSILEINHFTDLLRTFLLASPAKLNPPNKGCNPIRKLYSATQLHEAGVKFKKGESKCFLDMKFEKGVLEIPCLSIVNDTEALIRNVMALEQTHYVGKEYITNYFLVMDFLINTTKDVNLLCDKKIVVNYLGDNTAARQMVNDLNKGILLENMTPEYHQLCLKLNKFYENRWHNWMATLRHDYFRSPWRSASTIAAIILLVLTFIQTIFSIL